MQTAVLRNVKQTYQCPKEWASIVDKNDPEFCTLCQKKVHDLTTKSPEEIRRLFSTNNGEICAKILPEQLERHWIETENRLKWRVFMAAITTLFTFSFGKVSAQSTKAENPVEQTEFKYAPNGDIKCVSKPTSKIKREEPKASDTNISVNTDDFITLEEYLKTFEKRKKRKKYYWSWRFPFVHKVVDKREYREVYGNIRYL